MHGANRPPFHGAGGCSRADIPFALPADSVEITLDLPMPVSTNKLYAQTRKGVYRSPKYLRWMEAADMTVMADKAYPKRKIVGPFEVEILLGISSTRGDGDNKIKALLDWLQSRDIIRNDSDCRRGSWEWVESARAPKGCRVILRSLHGAD